MTGWSIPLDRLAAKVSADLDTVVRKVTFELFASVIRKSPVKTGRFRANWNVSYAKPNYAVTSETFQSERGELEVRKVLTMKSGGVAYLVNALPYAVVLENGSSRQAPSGMVRLSIVEIEQHIARALAK